MKTIHEIALELMPLAYQIEKEENNHYEGKIVPSSKDIVKRAYLLAQCFMKGV